MSTRAPSSERVYPIDGSYYVYYMLQNLVIEAQPRIRRMIGADLWDEMVGDEPGELAQALLPLCRRYAVLSALSAFFDYQKGAPKK